MLSFVWAEDENHAIGYQGHLPWYLPNDLKHFKDKTMGYPMLMGRKTFESLPKILPGRKHLVLTSNPRFKEKYINNTQVEIFLSCDEVKSYLENHSNEKISVIGGRSIFFALMDQVDLLEKTEIYASFPADVYMPKINYQDFEPIKKEDHHRDDKNEYDYSFLTYQRKMK